MEPTAKRWRLKPAADERAAAELVHERCPPPAARLLVQRGLSTREAASRFFRPSLGDLHDPFLMRDMDRAVERLERALGDNERIMVYGDYDVDGTTAVALVYSFLHHFTGNLVFYIPDRYAEGYGLSIAGIDHAAREGVSLIIALDCGIKAIDKVAYAGEKGIDVIICDHHRPGAELPTAVAVLDPKRADCAYPEKELSGCGIGFKLMQALAQRNGIPGSELEALLDLVAISTACDIVPVVGENRILMHHGLRRLNERGRPGVQAMLGAANVHKRLTVTDVVFGIGPRINAAGRMEHGRQAVELLLARDMGQAEMMAQRIDMNNADRQQADRSITEAALGHIAADEDLRRSWSTVVYHESWHKGVIGIVASRLTERYYRPTVVLTASNGKAVGSARSVKGYDVYEAISSCSALLDQYGGHMYAAGLTMPLENVEAFRARFEEVVRATIRPEQRVPEEEVDLELALTDITHPLVRVLHHMAPYGPGNMRPTFLTRGVTVVGEPKVVKDEHLKMALGDPAFPGLKFDAIAFRMADRIDVVRSGEPFSILYVLEENEWRGNTTIQLNIKDIKPGVSDVLAGEEEHTPAMERSN
jgi:single-stranded-DNA-specific exonuclease